MSQDLNFWYSTDGIWSYDWLILVREIIYWWLLAGSSGPRDCTAFSQHN